LYSICKQYKEIVLLQTCEKKLKFWERECWVIFDPIEKSYPPIHTISHKLQGKAHLPTSTLSAIYTTKDNIK
jgi:hypothetical protein